jgi:predicted  nucleic acid-binding Zn-ribbon protein
VAEAEAREDALHEAGEEFARLTADVGETRQRLRALEESLDAVRKERETAAAEAKQYARAAEKSRRTAMLAKERVLRLRNTPD